MCSDSAAMMTTMMQLGWIHVDSQTSGVLNSAATINKRTELMKAGKKIGWKGKGEKEQDGSGSKQATKE